ncbi:MAG: hypothetical protein NXI31_06650 [bacterium]|nr:hypothetical protein [bacterium]
MSETATPAATTSPGKMATTLLWVAVIFGPGTLAIAYLAHATNVAPGALAAELTMPILYGHYFGMVLTVGIATLGRGIRKTPEFWLLVAYQVAILTWLLTSRPMTAALHVAAAIAALLALTGLTRLAAAVRAKLTPSAM